MHEDQPEFEFQFDRNRTLRVKLGRTFLMLVVGVFFLIFTVLLAAAGGNQWWLIALRVAVHISWTFWALGLLQIWFNWTWLNSLYRTSEKHFVHLAELTVWLLPVAVIGAVALVWYLVHIGVLPVQPR